MRSGRAIVYALLFFLVTINYVDRVALSVAARPIASAFDISPVQMGYLFSSFLWTYLASLIPMGILVDRIGTRAVSAAGMAVWSLATMATGLTFSFASLLATRLVMGAGEATTYPAGGRVIREWTPRGERGLATTIFNCGGYAGPAFGSLLVGWLASWLGWRGAFFVAGGIGLVWLAIWLALFRRPEEARFIGADERARIIAERDAATADLAGPSSPSGLLVLLRSRTMWGLALTQGCAVYTQYLLLTWLPSYLQATRDLSILRTGLYTSLPYFGAVILSVLVGCRVGPVAEAFRRRRHGRAPDDGRHLAARRREHPCRAAGAGHLVDPGTAHPVADGRRLGGIAEHRADQRSADPARRRRQGDGHSGLRRQRVRPVGADRHRLRHCGDNNLQRRVPHRRLLPGQRRDDLARSDPRADRGGVTRYLPNRR